MRTRYMSLFRSVPRASQPTYLMNSSTTGTSTPSGFVTGRFSVTSPALVSADRGGVNTLVVLAQADFAGVVEELGVGNPAGYPGQSHFPDRPIEEMHVESLRLGVPCQARVSRRGEFLGGLRAGGDAAVVEGHPASHTRQGLLGPPVEAARGRSGRRFNSRLPPFETVVDQQVEQLRDALPGFFVAVVAPRAAEGLAGFPNRSLLPCASVGQSALHVLLGRHQVVAAGHVLQVKAVVDEHLGLELATDL